MSPPRYAHSVFSVSRLESHIQGYSVMMKRSMTSIVATVTVLFILAMLTAPTESGRRKYKPVVRRHGRQRSIVTLLTNICSPVMKRKCYPILERCRTRIWARRFRRSSTQYNRILGVRKTRWAGRRRRRVIVPANCYTCRNCK